MNSSRGVRCLRQAITVAEFTDGGATAGTLALTAKIPAGAYVLACNCSSLTGFAGDVSAAVIVGDGTDTDRYNTGTPDWFTTAALGLDMGVPSGVKYHAVATTVTVTVTTNADFTTCKTNGAGAATVEIFYVIGL